MRTKLMALEAIHYQTDTSFFKELIAIIEAIQNDEKVLGGLLLTSFYKHDKIQAIVHCVKKHTNILLELKGPDSNCNPAVLFPSLTKNHAFNLMWTEPVDKPSAQDTQAVQLFEKMKEVSKTVIGTVDIRTARVGGVFGTAPLLLALPTQMLLGVGIWKTMRITAEEIAACILHEVGHVFTYYEYLDRVVTTNQVLAGLARANTNKDLESKKIIISQSARDLVIAPDDIKKLLETEDNTLTAVILVQSAKNQCISELGASLYDHIGCEQVADQFANRMGAGRAIVTFLDKFITYQIPKPNSFPLNVIVGLMHGYAWLGNVSDFFWNLLFATFVSDQYVTIYDDPKVRYTRVKHDMVNQLKNQLVVGAQRDQILSDIAAIDSVIERTDPAVLSIVNKLTYFFSSSRKKVYESTLLQKELEEFASSNLFIHAAKLKQILN